MRISCSCLTLFVLTLVCPSLSTAQVSPAPVDQLMAGFGKADISPNHPVATIYTRSDPAKRTGKIADRLYARTTYLSCGAQQVAIISCDLLGVDGDFCSRLRRRISAFGIPEANIAINSSHTHTSPQTIFLRGVLMADDEYMQMLGERVVESVKAAMGSAEKALIGYGTVETNLNVNRIKIGRLRDINDLDAPSGPVDGRVKVVRLDLLESRKTALLVSFACHPLTVSADTFLISADYPGRLCSTLEALPDVDFAQFLQGCGGNMNPKIHGSLPVVDKYASLLALKVREAYPKLRTSSRQHLRMKTANVTLQKGPMPTVEAIEGTLKKYTRQKKPHTWASKRAMSWAEDALEALRSEREYSKISLLVQIIRLDDFMMVALPGEVFAEIGMEIEKRIGGDVLVVGYSNNAEAGYIPVAEQFPLGGYEVLGAPKYYDLFPYVPETAEHLISATVETALDMKDLRSMR